MTEKVLFCKNEMEDANGENDEWDDTLLIRAYDKAVKLAKEKITEKIANEKDSEAKQNGEISKTDSQPKANSSKRQKWKVGMCCQAEYSMDGRDYEAVIKSLDLEEGLATIKYIGYGNEEEVEVKDLRPSRGKEAQYAQKIEAQQLHQPEGNQIFPHQIPSYTGSSQNSTAGVIPPPPPPFVMANMPKDETDALSAMLMSWYMSGYHTDSRYLNHASDDFSCHIVNP